MGQQQLLLITLGVIIVSIAVTTGIAYFNQSSIDANRDAVVMDLNYLADYAFAYFKKPKTLAGGGGSFVGFSIQSQLDTTSNGNYNIISVSNSKISIKGIGVESVSSVVSCNPNTNKIQYTIDLDDNQNRTVTKNQ